MRTLAEIQTAFAPTDALASGKPFFLVGIGGAGMSALARMLCARGEAVMGSDSNPTALTAELESLGISVRIGHFEDSLPRDAQVVLTDAVDLNESPEVRAARRLGLPIFRRSQLLGWLLRGKRTIAVTGTHGKTTTTGLAAAALLASGLDPTLVVGAEVPEFGSAVVEGSGDLAIVEACEAYDSFHDLDPFIVILTNLELDHVDFHGSLERLRASVQRFLDRIPPDGALIYCAEDPEARQFGEAFAGTAIAYGPTEWEIKLPGRHNRLNAGAAVALASFLGLDAEPVRQALRDFGGAERRLQVLREGAITVVDDYAHHPTEIAASLGALRERYPGRRLVVVYQPHLYSRTQEFLADFAKALSAADLVVLTDIYPARETPIPGISSARIAELIPGVVRYVPSRHLLPREMRRWVRDGDVVVGMGAGTIGEFAPAFLKELDRHGPVRVTVIYGGDSTEREVSLLSGRAVHRALEARGYAADLVDVSEVLLRTGDLKRFVGEARPDVAFLCVHGTNAEDGAIQGLFELLHLPYTGSGIQSSALAMDKEMAKRVLKSHGLPVPLGVFVTSASDPVEIEGPLVVKPNAQGSTVGVTFLKDRAGLPDALAKALVFGAGALVEEWLVGMEISVPVLVDQALPPVEIAPTGGVYDFEAKYTPGATVEIVPARLSTELTELAQHYALEAHRALGCRGATRTDMIVTERGPVILEVNTIPGMTGTSLLPNSAQAAGISFEELCDRMVRSALEAHAQASPS